MEKFKDVVIKLSENAAPHLKILIQEHLTKFTAAFHTPDHPPYAAMIHGAILELNEKRGSSEESISEYIKSQQTDLPLAHNSLLKHHLGKLCDSGEIVLTGKHLYLLPGSYPTPKSSVNTEKDRVTRKRKAKKGRRGRVSKKFQKETDGEMHGEEHGETNRCYKVNVEIIGDNNEMEVDNKVNRVGELDQVVKQTELDNRMLDEQSQPHQQLSHAICAPVVDSKQPDHLSPDRPPGFEFITFQSKQKDVLVQGPEMISNSGSKSTSSDVSTELLPSQNQQQQMDLLNSDGLQSVKCKDVKLLEPHSKSLKQYGRRKKLKSMTKEKEMQDVTVELEQKTKQLDLSDLDKLSQPLSAECEQKLEFCQEKQIPESKQQVTLTCYDADMLTKQEHDKSVSNNPIEQQGTKTVGQVVRRSQRLAQSIETYTLSLDLLPSSQSQFHGQPMLENDQLSLQVKEVPQLKMEVDYVNLAQKLQRLQLPAVDSVQTTNQTHTGSSELSPDQVQMVDTTIISQQRSKLRSWQKCSISPENILTATEQVRQEPLFLEYYQQPAALNEPSMQQQAHTKLSGTTELEADTSTMDMPPSHDERPPQMHQGKRRGRGRPPKMKWGQGSMQNP